MDGNRVTSCLPATRLLLTTSYTSMAENLDPEEVHQIMDGCFKILMVKIHKHEGTINQFTGDGVMALFGAPVAHEDHAQKDCRAALAIQNVIGQYGKKIKKDWGIESKLSVGLNSGLVSWMSVSYQVIASIPV